LRSFLDGQGCRIDAEPGQFTTANPCTSAATVLSACLAVLHDVLARNTVFASERYADELPPRMLTTMLSLIRIRMSHTIVLV
jgi:hypothetical protein